MKTIKYLTAFALATVLLGSCEARYNNGNNGMPPGQAKNIWRSAKDYAPGQRKKQRSNTTIIVNP